MTNLAVWQTIDAWKRQAVLQGVVTVDVASDRLLALREECHDLMRQATGLPGHYGWQFV
jgi:hypothetical protein